MNLDKFDIENELIQIRRYLHSIPEIGTKEFKTSAYIKSKLDEYNIPYKTYYNTGIAAYINPNKDKTILLRADIDALPQTEETNLEFSSVHEGLMHACGHDFHMTCLLGAAKILKTLESEINGRIILIFQPDEEFDGGAEKMIEEGAAKGAEAAVAMHIEPQLETGFIQIKDGAIMASPDDFALEIIGKGGHGACPEKCVNPLSAISEIIPLYHDIPNQTNEKSVVTVCTVQAGTASPNIIPDKAYLTGTARSLNEDTRDFIKNKLQEIAKEICQKYNADFKFTYNALYPPLINDENMNKLLKNSAEKVGAKVKVLSEASMTGDDFSYFSKIVPSTYFKLGTGNEKLGMYPLHSARLNPDEKALILGSKIFAQTAIDYLE